jgi:hypothetical protein
MCHQIVVQEPAILTVDSPKRTLDGGDLWHTLASTNWLLAAATERTHNMISRLTYTDASQFFPEKMLSTTDTCCPATSDIQCAAHEMVTLPCCAAARRNGFVFRPNPQRGHGNQQPFVHHKK